MMRVIGCITDQHDLRLVVLAALICVLACYTAFSLKARTHASVGLSRLAWLFAAAFVTGSGVWATHFVAELAFRPGLPIAYDLSFTAMSVAVAIALSGAGLGIALGRGHIRTAVGGAVVGFGVAAMHYTGMAALRLPAVAHWDVDYVVASIAISTVGSSLALLAARRRHDIVGRLQATTLLVLAIVGLHFTGMAAISFAPDPTIAIPDQAIPPEWLAVAIAATSFLIVGLGLVGSIVDQHLAERTQSEAAILRHHVTQLESTKAELTCALQKAASANNAKSQFLAKMSHEIRTPLNGILTSAELLRRSGLTSSQTRLTTLVQRSGDTLLTLINEILDLSKLEAGKLLLEPGPFDLCAHVTETSEILAAEAAQKSLGLFLRLPEGRAALWVNGDSLRFGQIVTNLISNAIKFTHQGEICVRLQIIDETVDAFQFALTISDSGIGLPDGFRVRMFEPFTQAYETATRTYGGTGLGLSIVKQIVDLMNGEIEVKSEPGKGTAFRILFAMDKTAPPVTEIESGRIPNPAELKTRRLVTVSSQGKILVAEDNSVNQEVIAESLSTLDYDFTIVENGIEAVAAAQTGQFGLVLMDCRMPVMDGFDAARAIRKAERERDDGSHIPIIALSANAMKGDREECLAAGMDDHMAKPFKLNTLEAVLERWISGGSIAPAEATADSGVSTRREPATAGFSTFDETPLAQISSLQQPGRPDVLAKIVGTFVSTTPTILQQIRDALMQGDLAAVRDLAHGLKASSASLGAVGFSEACRALERLAGDGNGTAVQNALSELSDGFLTVKTKLVLYAQHRRTASAGERANRAAG